MKRWFPLFLCLLVLSGATFSALAVEEEATLNTSATAPTSPIQMEVTLISPVSEESTSAEDTAAMLEALERIEANTQGQAQGEEFAVATASVAGSTSDLDTAPAREGLAGVINSIFGEYTPRTYTTSTYIDGETVETTEIVPGLAGLDWPWLCGVALFSLMLYSVLRLFGGVLR